MPKSFTPSFKDMQKDIERYLKSEGKVEKNEHGQEVYREYPAALSLMFRLYMDEEAFVPLVTDFRKWNWEWSYNDYLLTLTARLQKTKNWPCLKHLWTAVIAKRKTNYNITRKFRKSLPEKIPESTLQKTRGLLLESLKRFEAYAAELGQESDITEYLDMMARVQKGGKA
ncbi:MAG TPA: hypothetical protein VFI68_04835 [Anaerolineales bacterium]|nr:hypothetical protein [Anaerolineales bacterium]